LRSCLLFLNFYIAIIVCFCHCCSTTVTPGSYGVDRVSVVARLAICYIAPLNGGTTYAIRATSTLNTPIYRRRIVVVATAVATGKCSSSAWGCWLWLHYRRLGCCRSLRSRRDDYRRRRRRLRLTRRTQPATEPTCRTVDVWNWLHISVRQKPERVGRRRGWDLNPRPRTGTGLLRLA
jgi:hypothetical protein